MQRGFATVYDGMDFVRWILAERIGSAELTETNKVLYGLTNNTTHFLCGRSGTKLRIRVRLTRVASSGHRDGGLLRPHFYKRVGNASYSSFLPLHLQSLPLKHDFPSVSDAL